MAIPNLNPPGLKTDHANPSCYLKHTNNCSKDKSREHYISENILRKFTQLNVSGMPWQKTGETQQLPSSALAANILCRRHNSSLSPLDELAGNSFDVFTASANYAANQRHAGKVMHHLVSGHGLELWMYKLTAGIYFGGIAAVRKGRLRDVSSLPEARITDFLTNGSLSTLGGMYVTQNVGLISGGEIGIAPLIDVASKDCVGVQVQFGALRFETTIVDPNLPPDKHVVMKQRLRPHVIDYCGPARDSRVVMTWPKTRGEFRRLALVIAPGQ